MADSKGRPNKRAKPQSLWDYHYLSDEQIKGFEKYKYSCMDTSPLSKYLMHPFWNACVNLFPTWVAPNVMTMTGFMCVIFMAIMFSYYDPIFQASSDSLPGEPIPNIVWLIAAILHFWAHTLDGLDGKQARRTGSSGPLGELFDHGLDSWTSLFTPFCIYSMFGSAEAEFAFPPLRVQFIFWTVFATFYLSHWEKYNTGILYLPWSYDLTQITLFFMYIFTYIYGYHAWNFEFMGLSAGVLFELISHFGSFGLSIPFACYNVVLAYVEGKGKQANVYEALRPLVPFFLLFALSVYWSFYSPMDIMNKRPREFLFIVGTVFSNIAMSNTRCEIMNNMVVVMGFCVSIIFTCSFSELSLTYALVVGVLIGHIHYGCCVVRQMADHFNIYVFRLGKKSID